MSFIEDTSALQVRFELKTYNVERRLGAILQDIREEKAIFHGRKIILPVARAFLQEAKEKPWTTSLKCFCLLNAIGSFYPVMIGSIACLNSYTVAYWPDLFSANLTNASAATQILSNSGQGISFIVQAFEMLLVPTSIWILRGPYYRTVCQKIDSIYNAKILHNPDLNTQERAFLIEKANQELACWNGLPIYGEANRNNIELIQQQIDRDIEEHLSLPNIVRLMLYEKVKEGRNSPWLTTLAKTIGAIVLCTLTLCAAIPELSGTIACFAAWHVTDPNTLYSSDLVNRTNAVAVFSNVGHVVEYTVTAFFLAYLTGKLLLGEQFKKASRHLIGEVYDNYIQDASLSREASDLFYKRKQAALVLVTFF